MYMKYPCALVAVVSQRSAGFSPFLLGGLKVAPTQAVVARTAATLATTTSGQFMLPRLTPQLYLLDRSGVIAYKTEGQSNPNLSMVTAKIDALLSGSAQRS